MDITERTDLEGRLKAAVGTVALNEMTEEIIQILRKHNLDYTPAILDDYLLYLRQTIFII